MIAKKKMDDYNWPDLYRQAYEFMHQYIPETNTEEPEKNRKWIRHEHIA